MDKKEAFIQAVQAATAAAKSARALLPDERWGDDVMSSEAAEIEHLDSVIETLSEVAIPFI